MIVQFFRSGFDGNVMNNSLNSLQHQAKLQELVFIFDFDFLTAQSLSIKGSMF